MGRHLVCGIVTKITISKANTMFSNENFSVIDNKDKILSKLKKYLDLDNYDSYWDKTNNILELEIKEDYVNKHIHNLILELDKLTDTSLDHLAMNLIYSKNINPNDFNETNYPLTLHKYTETDTYENDYQKDELLNNYALVSGSEYNVEVYDCFSSQWILDNTLIYDVKINNSFIVLWLDVSKISCEDESALLRVLNTLSKSYFTNPLGKNLLFNIL